MTTKHKSLNKVCNFAWRQFSSGNREDIGCIASVMTVLALSVQVGSS